MYSFTGDVAFDSGEFAINVTRFWGINPNYSSGKIKLMDSYTIKLLVQTPSIFKGWF